MKPSPYFPKVSVVVIGRNEGKRLTRCLESVFRMNYPNSDYEVIYVDSCSTDDSVERSKSFPLQTIQLQTNKPSASLARNNGWRIAKGELILFLDGDTVIHPDFIISSISHFDDPQIAIIWGACRELNPNFSLFNRVIDLDWIYPAGYSDFCGGIALMRKDVLKEVDGFNNDLMAGEEPEMCRRIRLKGYKILHTNTPMVYHDLAMTHVWQYWRRCFRSGYAYAEVAHRFKHTIDQLWYVEAKQNLIKGSLLMGLLILGLLALILFHSLLPLGLLLCLITMQSIATATRIGWKSPKWTTRLLYGFHSHLQHIPIFFGQLAYWFDRYRNRNLIEVNKDKG